eukprot:PRCOL_00002130-RA
MWVATYDEFKSAARALYDRNPLKTRYSIKYRHCEGLLVVKITDDETVLKYKTDQLQDLKRLEKLNNLMFTLMALGEVPPEDELAASGAAGSAGGGGKDDAVAAAPAKKKGRRQ